MIYDQLDVGVRRWIDDHGWTRFTEIQERAIPPILGGAGALIVAPTSMGKTEAAFFPIISEVRRLKLRPISVLYISPLRALVNDQTRRARSLLEECGLRVGWWHGDLQPAERKKLLSYVPDALFTTPESIEVILSSDGYGHGVLLGDVRFVVVDEIHAFAGGDRRSQMISLLARIESLKATPLTRIALSATVNNPREIVQWFKSNRSDAPDISIVTADVGRARRLAVGCLGIPDGDGLKKETSAQRVARVIRSHAQGRRTIVFVNSRQDAERITVLLRETGTAAMVHHGSIHRSERQRIEASFRQEEESIIVATSTLELGIDIGDMDTVIQIGAPASSLSLLQRIGRSGRREGRTSVGLVYAFDEDDLPMCLAAAELAANGMVEDLHPQVAAVHVLFHQVLQALRERGRATRSELQAVLCSAGCFRAVTLEEFDDLISEMLKMGFLEPEREWLQVGSETERRFSKLNYRDFYSVFESELEWTVKTHSQVIGTIGRGYPIAKDRETLLVLGGRAWRVVQVDEAHLILIVEPAAYASIPKWHSSGPGFSYEVTRAAYEIICGRTSPFESAPVAAKLANVRRRAKERGWLSEDTPIEVTEVGLRLMTYYGTTLNEYVAMLFRGIPTVDRTMATETFVSVSGLPIERLREEFRGMLGSSERRRALLEEAIRTVHAVRVGRFWGAFGSKTKIHALRRFFSAGEPVMEQATALKALQLSGLSDEWACIRSKTSPG